MPSQQDLAVLAAISRGYFPMAPGLSAPMRTGFENIPVPFGTPGQLAFMLAGQPMLRQAMGQVGMMPLGLGHEQNIWDAMQETRFTALQQQAVQQAAMSDVNSYVQTLRGLAHLTGTPWGAGQHAAARRFSTTLAQGGAGLVGAAPDFFDQLAGSYGSAAVMAHRVMEGGRYRIDPVTGATGMSSASAARMAQLTVEDFRAGGFGGVSAGQVGVLFQEMQQRGLIGTAASQYGADWRAQSRRDALYRLSGSEYSQALTGRGIGAKDIKDLTAIELDQLAADPMVESKLRTMDVERVRKTLKSYTAAITAVRDIFGDAGHPNAPMKELMGALEALTGGASAQLPGDQLGRMARTTYNIARNAGMPLSSAMLLQQHAGAAAQQMGLDPVFGVSATQGAMAYRGAYTALGMGAHPAWGAMTADQLMQADANLRIRGAGSAVANQLAVLRRIGQASGGFAPGSAAAAALDAVNRGDRSYRDPTTGRLLSLDMSDNALAGLIRGGAPQMTEADVYAMLLDRHANQGAMVGTPIDAIARGLQESALTGHAQRYVEDTLDARYGTNARGAGAAVMARLRGLSGQQFADPQIRNRELGQAALRAMRQAGVAIPAGVNAGLLGEQLYGRIDRSFAEGPFPEARSAAAYRQVTDPVTAQQAAADIQRADLERRIQEKLSVIPAGSPVRLALQALQTSGQGDAAARVIAAAAGGVDKATVSKSLLSGLQELERLRAEALQAPDGRARDAALTALGQQAQLIDDIARRNNLTTAGLSPGDMLAGERSSRRLLLARDDAAAWAAGVSLPATPEERARVLVDQPGLNTASVDKIVMERRAAIPAVPEEDKVQALMQQYGVSYNEAFELQAARNRADRLGFSGRAGVRIEDAVRRGNVARHGSAYVRLELAAIRDAFDQELATRYAEPTTAEIDAWKKSHAGLNITPDLRRRMVDADPSLRGKSDTEIDAAIARMGVLDQRERGVAGRLREYWASSSGALFRDETSEAINRAEAQAQALLNNPAAVEMLGPGAIASGVELQQGVDRQRQLAARYTKGDLARLNRGDWDAGALDVRTVKGRQQAEAVAAENDAILRRRVELQSNLQNPGGQPLTAAVDQLTPGATPAAKSQFEARLRFLRGSTEQERALAARHDQAGRSLLETAQMWGFTSISDLRTALATGGAPAWVDTETLTQVGLQLAAYDKEAAQLTSAANRIGGANVGPGLPVDYEGTDDVRRALETYQKQHADRAVSDPTSLTKALMKAHGYGDDTTSAAAQKLQQALSDARGMSGGRRLLAGRANLEARAATAVGGGAAYADVREMLDRYRDDPEAVRRRLGLNEQEWLQFRDDVQFQRSSAGSLDAMTKSIQDFAKDSAQEAAVGKLEMSGTVAIDMVNSTADMSSAYATGTLPHAVPARP